MSVCMGVGVGVGLGVYRCRWGTAAKMCVYGCLVFMV